MKKNLPWHSDFRVKTINVEPANGRYNINIRHKNAERLNDVLSKLGFTTHINYTSVDVYAENITDEQIKGIKEIANMI